MATTPRSATIKDIARRAGVSISTVHYALRRTRPISAATRERVLAAVQELDYQPHAGAATLPSGRTSRLGVVIAGIEPAFANTYFSDFMRGLAAGAEAEDHNVVLYTAYGRRSLEGWRPSYVLRRHEADGLALLGTQFQPEHLEELATLGLPCVLLNQVRPDLPCVTADRRQGSRLAVEHLLRLGRRPVGLLAARFHGAGPDERRPEYTGYLDAHAAAGVAHDPSLVAFAEAADPAAVARAHVRRVASLGTSSGLVVFSYSIAPAACQAVVDLHVKVPEDQALVVGDGDESLLEPLGVPITLVRTPKFEIGQAAARLLIRQVRGEVLDETARHLRLPMSLEIRRSSGAPVPRTGPGTAQA